MSGDKRDLGPWSPTAPSKSAADVYYKNISIPPMLSLYRGAYHGVIFVIFAIETQLQI
jgi:hypothetical protein